MRHRGTIADRYRNVTGCDGVRTRFIGGMQAIIDAYALRAYAAGLPATIVKLTLVLQATPQIASYHPDTNTVVLADYAGLPPEAKMLFGRWAADANNGWNGERFVEESFHWFFVAHELTHWVQFKTPIEVAGDRYQSEFQANQGAVGFWRSTPAGSARLDAFVKALVAIRATLPDPVPPGEDPRRFFNEHYGALGTQPLAYGWYQTSMVIEAAKVAATFEDVLRPMLPAKAG